MRKQLMICGAIFALLALPAMAQKSELAPESHCDGAANNDIGPLFPSQPNGSFVVASGDCTGEANCNDYFMMNCGGGETVTATFCSNGGSASWDTALRAFDGADIDCNDDTCGLQSTISFVAPAGGFEIRVDGFADANGSYNLAVNAPSSCTILGAVPVTLQTIEVE